MVDIRGDGAIESGQGKREVHQTHLLTVPGGDQALSFVIKNTVIESSSLCDTESEKRARLPSYCAIFSA